MRNRKKNSFTSFNEYTIYLSNDGDLSVGGKKIRSTRGFKVDQTIRVTVRMNKIEWRYG